MVEKLLNRYVGDERKRKAYGRSAIITLFLMWMYMIVRMLLVATGVWNTNLLVNDLYFVMISIVVFTTIALRKEYDETIRSFIFSRELPYKEGRFSGRFPIYIGEAFVGAVVLTIAEWLIVSLINLSFTVDILMFVSSVIAFTVILTLVFTIIGESSVRKYRKEFDD